MDTLNMINNKKQCLQSYIAHYLQNYVCLAKINTGPWGDNTEPVEE